MITRFAHSICRYDQDDVIRRVLALLGFPPPPPGQARECADDVLRKDGLVEALAAVVPHSGTVLAQRAHLAAFLKLLDVPRRVVTPDQVNGSTLIGKSLLVASKERRVAVEIHAGIGVLFHDGETGTMISQVAPITGPGMDTRRDYLLSVIDAARTTLEQQFS